MLYILIPFIAVVLYFTLRKGTHPLLKTVGILCAIVVILYVLVVIGFNSSSYTNSKGQKHISGTVFSCHTGEPIAGAQVSLDQRGWGNQNGNVVWDKMYPATTTTDQQGNFSMNLELGSAATIYVDKEGYYRAEQHEYPKEGVTIKLLEGKPSDINDVSTYCKPLSECLQQTSKGIENVCTHY